MPQPNLTLAEPLGTCSPLETCSMEPRTGFARSGTCEAELQHIGSHTVRARVTTEVLEDSRAKGNELVTPGDLS